MAPLPSSLLRGTSNSFRTAVCGAAIVCALGCSGSINVLPARTDAGSGSPDAAANSLPDSGVQDAGTPDAGGPDAGAPDAGSRTGVFVAVGYGARTVRSVDDGRTWTDDAWLDPNGGDDNTLLEGVAYGGDQFVAVGRRTMTSPDGRSWTDRGVMSQWLAGVAFGQGKWVAAGGYGRRTQSADGFTWMDGPADGVTYAFRGMTYDAVAGRWVAIGDSGARYSTGDGAVWTGGVGEVAAGVGGNVAAGGGSCVAVNHGQVIRSTDGGQTWTLVTTLAAGDDVAYAASQFVVVGGQHIFTSPDGLQWKDHAVPWFGGAIACHDTICVVLNSKAWRSVDSGETWTAAVPSTASSQGLLRVTWGFARGPG